MNSSPMSVAPSLALAGPAEIQVFLRRRARGQRWFFAGLAMIALVVAAVAGKGDPAALVVAGVFVAVMALFTHVGRRRLAATWRGEVVRKEVREIRHRKADDAVVRRVDHEYLLHVRTVTGSNLKVKVGLDALDHYYAVGDRVVKIGGLPSPLRLAPGHPGLCAGCGISLSADVVACPRCHCPVPDPARF